MSRSFIYIHISEGLKDNPLYVTSGDVSNAADGPVYGVVNKSKQNKDKIRPDDKKDQGPVYSEVQKSNTQGTVFIVFVFF